jgi:hypothetical protein
VGTGFAADRALAITDRAAEHFLGNLLIISANAGGQLR